MHLHLSGFALLAADAWLEGFTRAVAVHGVVGAGVTVGIVALFRRAGRDDRLAEDAHAKGVAHHDERGQLIRCGGCGRPSWDGNAVDAGLCCRCTERLAVTDLLPMRRRRVA